LVIEFFPEGSEAREEGYVCAVAGEVALGLFTSVWVVGVCGAVEERGEESVVLVGEVVAECGIGEGEGVDLVQHITGVALGSDEASEGGWGVAA
jgi:hypothetical protein